jgi:D-alanine-D-alanine ligase-like ATP-grasp enzyme
MIKDFKPKPCEECGMGGVHHNLERWTLRIDAASSRIFSPLDWMAKHITPLTDSLLNTLGPPFYSLLVRTGLAVKLSEPDDPASETARCLWDEAKHRGIEMHEIRIFGLPRRQFISRYRGKTWVFEGLPRPARKQHSLSWIDNKAEMKKRFIAAGFPVAQGAVCKNESQAIEVFKKLEKPVIAKPHEGSGGRHTTVFIQTEDELARGYRNARLISPWVIIEEQLFGPVFRATLINKNLVAVLRRDPPHVTGDGRSTIAKLVEEENKNPLRRGPMFADIDVNSSAAARELKRQDYTIESIPDKGERIYFHFKVNWGVGGTSRDATDEVHPENRKLFEDIGAYLQDDIVGIDFIIEDIGQSWRETKRCGVIECNSLPAIGNHHFPFTGPVKNVAGVVWDMIFPGSADKR